MYANQFAADRGFKPGSMTLALALTALPIAGLVHVAGRDQADRGYRDRSSAYPVHETIRPRRRVEPKTKVDTKAPINETPYVPPITPVTPSRQQDADDDRSIPAAAAAARSRDGHRHHADRHRPSR